MPPRNPTMTECDTNEVNRPSRATPAPTWNIPMSRMTRKSVSVRACPWRSPRVPDTAMAAALVVVTIMSCDETVRPPRIGPTMLA